MLEEKNLLFLVSQPRSGSTLLQAILSNSSRIETSPEPWLLLPYLSEIATGVVKKATYDSDICSVALKEFLGPIQSQYYQQLKGFLLAVYSAKAVCNSNIFLDKTPRYYEILPEIRKIFPNSKIIILKRNPLAVLNSIITTKGRVSYKQLYSKDRDILFAPFLIQSFIEKEEKNELTYIVKYEDFIKSPLMETKKICEFVGVPFTEELIEYGANDKFIGTMGDKKILHKAGIIDSEKPSWDSTILNSHWNSFFKGYMNFLGDSFLNEYGYSGIESGKSRVFDLYLHITERNLFNNGSPISDKIIYQLADKIGLNILRWKRHFRY